MHMVSEEETPRGGKKQFVACNEINQKKKHPTCINHKLSLVFVGSAC